jgi:hypothetical protein
MAQRWEDMTPNEKANQLNLEMIHTRTNIASLARHIDEIGTAVKEIEKKLGANK